jgi:hypothetical protein
MMEFNLSLDGNDDGEKIYPAVFITCNNCNTLTGLGEVIEDKTDWKKLKLIKKY